MSAIARIFEFDSHELRTVIRDGNPWFVAKDVCTVLAIANPSDAVRSLDDDEVELVPAALVTTEGRPQDFLNLINEPGLYSLILRSRKPEAKKFKRWITHDVVPTLRQTGTYSVQPPSNRELALMVLAEADRADHAEALAAERGRELEAVAPKVEYVDQFLRNDDSTTLRIFAKQIGVKEKALREHLIDRKVIYRQPIGKRFSESKQRWVDEYLYQPYASHGSWFTVGDQPRAPRLFNGQMRTTLYITPAGKVGVARLLERHPISLAIEGAAA